MSIYDQYAASKAGWTWVFTIPGSASDAAGVAMFESIQTIVPASQGPYLITLDGTVEFYTRQFDARNTGSISKAKIQTGIRVKAGVYWPITLEGYLDGYLTWGAVGTTAGSLIVNIVSLYDPANSAISAPAASTFA